MKYLDQYKQIHKEKKYGVSGDGHVPWLKKLIPSDADSILDYGAGQSNTAYLLKKETGIEDVVAYDPAVEGRDIKPERDFDVVVCTDVMEHVPEEEIDGVLTDIWGYAPVAVFAIALKPAAATLPNGENAHCTVKPKEWWESRLKQVWREVEYIPSKKYFWAWFKVSQ